MPIYIEYTHSLSLESTHGIEFTFEPELPLILSEPAFSPCLEYTPHNLKYILSPILVHPLSSIL